MRGRVRERHALVLRGDVAQVGRELGELGGRREAPVDERPAPNAPVPIELDRTAHEHLARAGDARSLEPCRDPRARGDLEERLDLGLALAGSEDLGLRPTPESKAERVQDDALSGPSFPGDCVETGGWLDDELLDEGDVSDRELDQHSASGCISPVDVLGVDSLAYRQRVRVPDPARSGRASQNRTLMFRWAVILAAFSSH